MTDDYLLSPFTVAIDSREQHPWTFVGFTADAAQKHRPIIVATEIRGLKSGDYSLIGHEDRVAIERKSLADAYQTFCHGRERFIRELERLQKLDFAAVVIEADWPTILHAPPPTTKFSPKSFFRSVVAWQVEFPRVQWWACPTRSFAERVAYRLLSRWWEKRSAVVQEFAKEQA